MDTRIRKCMDGKLRLHGCSNTKDLPRLRARRWRQRKERELRAKKQTCDI